jgi:hypothetical protein
MANGEKRVLSEDDDFLFRRVLPALHGVIGMILMLTGPREFGLLFLGAAAVVFGLSFISELWFYKVTLDGDALLISRFSRHVRVPLLWIVGVTGSLRSISIVFDRDTGLGTRINFSVPPFFGPGKEQPLIAELRELAGLPK